MSSSHWPLILIEGVLVFGGALAFGWWQLRSVRKDREEMLRCRQEKLQAQGEATASPESAAAEHPQAHPAPANSTQDTQRH